MLVSTMPGCKAAAKTVGFSAAKNSIILIRVSLELMYADMFTSLAAGKTTAAVSATTAARVGFAVGKKALDAIIVPLTFV
jgi:hypothetical protein